LFLSTTISKLVITCMALAYIAYLIVGLFLSYLGSNPIEVITHATGEWGLHFLLLTLMVSPLRRHFHWNSLMQLRRFLGLWCFAFLFLHFFIFIFFDHFFDWTSILEDIVERPYITLGFAGLVLMTPLAVTSFKRLQQKLGKAWFKLHRLIYPIAILGLGHYWWLVKADTLWPLLYTLVLVLLLADRVFFAYKKWAVK
jgi:sulfoxide reductase heme-binding subunit YedZ